ncbi:MAG: class II aldolase/adducin family protein [bacterium]|nr:class II aldolase/adducin family protein [bacterium]
MKKTIMDGYIGIKFDAQCRDKQLPPNCEKEISAFRENGKLLLQHQMAPANGGNMSTRLEDGFLITASGSNLGCLEDNEIVYVESFSIEEKTVSYRGALPPSSEAFLHGLLLKEKPHISSVIHAHDEAATSMELSGIIRESEKEEAYGTVALANACLDTFTGGCDIVVLKNHGYVAVGDSLSQATGTVIDMHKRLISGRENNS